MTEKTCNCERCLEGNYNPEDFMVPDEKIRQLDEPRPFGLSGHMVAKNEALTIKESVESLLPVLDELIITYQTSQDRTEEILMQLREQYPDKLRVFHYKPYLPPYGRLGDKEESNIYPDGSIHNPANYYNFGLVKHRYAFYMKVDGDQVYFTEKLKKMKGELHSLFRQPEWKKSRPAKCVWRGLYLLNLYLAKYSSFSPFRVNSKINRHLFAAGYYPDFAYSMAGLNVMFKKNKLVLQVDPLDFNSGVGDHFVLPVTSNNIYRWSASHCYEIFSVPKFIPVGFCWLHFKFIKIAMDTQYNSPMNNTVFIRNSKDITAGELLSNAALAKDSKRNQLRKSLLTHFWDRDKQYIPELPKLTQKMKQFLNEHK